MKKTYKIFTGSKSIKIALCFGLAIVLSSFSNNNGNVIICHVPPGNPGNCHEITISTNALQTHLDHGDKLYCDKETDYQDYLKLVNNNEDRLVKRY
jgi:hypothetical protein